MSRWTEQVRPIVAKGRAAVLGSAALAAQRYSPSGLLIGLVVAADILLVLSAFVFGHYFDIDVATSLTFNGADGNCDPALEGIGEHCFGDYSLIVHFAGQENPWTFLGVKFNYPAGGLVLPWIFGVIGTLTGSPRLALVLYLAVLVAAVSIPAIWATVGKPFTVRLGIVALFGVLSIPGLMALDRGNTVGLAALVMLVYLIGLARRRYGLVVVAVVIASLLKPQFAILIIGLVAARRWKHAGLAALLGVVANLAAFLLWPARFPQTIVQSIENTLSYGGAFSLAADFPTNVSFARGIYSVEMLLRRLLGRETDHVVIPGMLLAVAFTGLVVVAIVIAGRRIPPVIGGIAIMTVGSLLPEVTFSYYLVFVIPVAAVLLRDPGVLVPERLRWNGILDEPGDRRVLDRIAEIVLVVATAASVSRVLLPHVIDGTGGALVMTTSDVIPLLWGLAVLLLLVAYWTRPAVPADARPLPASTPS